MPRHLLTIAGLTVRQFLGSRALRVVLLIASVPVLFALIYLIDTSVQAPRSYFSQVIFRGLMVATLVPIATLLPATAAFGNEIEDRTLPYLILKPISRLRIVLEKMLAVLVTAFPILAASLAISYAIVFRRALAEAGNPQFLLAAVAATLAGVIAYGAVFLLVSLLIQRALLAGVTYILVWESLLGRFLPGLRLISIRHYLESIYIRSLDPAAYRETIAVGEGLAGANQLGSAWAVVIAVAVVSLGLAALKLRRIELD